MFSIGYPKCLWLSYPKYGYAQTAISTCTGLQNIQSNLSGSYYLTGNIDCSATSTWNGGQGFAPIGTFTGIFDGNGYSINNLYINRNNVMGALFHTALNATIKNVNLVNVNFQSYAYRSAGLVGYLNTSNLSDCSVSGSVSSLAGAAGLVAIARLSTITNSYSTVSVSGYGAYVGGLVGENVSATAVSSYWNIEISGQTTSILGEGKTSSQMKNQATFIGWNFETGLWCIREGVTYPQFCKSFNFTPITTCTELQNIKNNLSGNYQLANNINCSATSSWNSGKGFIPIGSSFNNAFTGFFDGQGYTISNLTINRTTEPYIGLFGYIVNATIQNVKLTNVNVKGNIHVGSLVGIAFSNNRIYNCSATGAVTNTNLWDGTHVYVGGLVGTINVATNIINSYATTNVTAVGSLVGGLVGYAEDNSIIINSYATGNVTSVQSWIGGLVGAIKKATISSSYATGNVAGLDIVGGLAGEVFDNSSVTNSYATGTIYGASNIGGLIGYIYQNCTITNSYAKGSVGGSGNRGGLVGGFSSNVTATNSYWDTQTSGLSSSALGEGKTTAQMKNQATFVDWDFDNIWCIKECSTYPLFKGSCASNVCSGCAVLNGNRCVAGTSCSEESECFVSCNVGTCGCTSSSCLAGKQCVSGTCVNCLTSNCGNCNCGSSQKPVSGVCTNDNACCVGECNIATGANSCGASDALCSGSLECNRSTFACCPIYAPYWRDSNCRACTTTSGLSGLCSTKGKTCNNYYNCVNCTADTECTCDAGQIANGSGGCVTPACTSDNQCGIDRCINPNKHNAFCSNCSETLKVWHDGSCKNCPASSIYSTGVCVCFEGKVWVSSSNTCENKSVRPSDIPPKELKIIKEVSGDRYNDIKSRMNRIKNKLTGGASKLN